MRCPRCQHENPTASNFCLGCGARFSISCSSCDNQLPAGSRFCNKCGTPVGLESASQSRFSSPESYTPKHLAERILTSKAALEGERKQVTVLFADLRGSMELLADRDPEEARKLLDPVLERMMEAVHRYEGTVNQVMGDGIMALFGAPLAHEDHAVRACYAALRMQESVRRYAEEARREHGVTSISASASTPARSSCAPIGSDLHMDYTAVGQTTHLAARMEQLAQPDQIFLTERTLRLVEGYIAVKSLGPVPVKGLAAPVAIYELSGPGPIRSRLQLAAARGLSRFVGRDAELGQLRRRWSRPGAATGKWLPSSANRESASRARPRVHHGPSAGGVAGPRGVHDLLRHERGVPADDLAAAGLLRPPGVGRRARHPRKSNGGAAGPRPVAPGDPPGPPHAARCSGRRPRRGRLDPRQRRQRTLDAIRRLLLRESQRQPLCLVLEDLHWIDPRRRPSSTRS